MPNGRNRVTIDMSYLEIYNEEARDLLVAEGDEKPLQIRESKATGGVMVQNLTTKTVTSPDHVRSLMEGAALRRATASTAMNAVSSRSHAICTLHLTILPPATTGTTLRAKLTLVDLAGSERLKRTAAEGKRMTEGININKGLFV